MTGRSLAQLSIGYKHSLSHFVLLPAASLSFRRPEEATSPRHGTYHSSSQQLVSGGRISFFVYRFKQSESHRGDLMIPIQQTPILEQTGASCACGIFSLAQRWRGGRCDCARMRLAHQCNEQPSPPHQRFIAAVIVIGRFRVDSPRLAGYLLARADSCAMAIAR